MSRVDEIKADYRRAIEVGEEIRLRRYTGTGPDRPWFDATVRARVMGYEPRELINDIKQGDMRVIMLAEDLEAAQVPFPTISEDLRVFVRDRPCAVLAIDDNTRRFQGTLIAIEMRVRGQ